MRKILTYKRLNMIRTNFKDNGIIFLFVARFLPGLRAAIYLFSGVTRKVSYFKFIAIDFFAAIISVPVWVFLGYFFGDNLPYLKDLVHKIGLNITIIAIISLVAIFIFIKNQASKRIAAKNKENLERKKAQSQQNQDKQAQTEQTKTEQTKTEQEFMAKENANPNSQVAKDASLASSILNASTSAQEKKSVLAKVKEKSEAKKVKDAKEAQLLEEELAAEAQNKVNHK